MAGTGEKENESRPDARPIGAFRFAVKVDGIPDTAARFQSVSGLSHEFEIVTHQEGGLNDRTHQLPGQGKYPNLVLKTGYLVNPALESWHRDFVKNRGPRRNVTVDLLDLSGAKVRSWTFERCWPVKWEGPQFDGSQAAIAVQTLELAHEGLT